MRTLPSPSASSPTCRSTETSCWSHLAILTTCVTHRPSCVRSLAAEAFCQRKPQPKQGKASIMCEMMCVPPHDVFMFFGSSASFFSFATLHFSAPLACLVRIIRAKTNSRRFKAPPSFVPLSHSCEATRGPRFRGESWNFLSA